MDEIELFLIVLGVVWLAIAGGVYWWVLRGKQYVVGDEAGELVNGMRVLFTRDTLSQSILELMHFRTRLEYQPHISAVISPLIHMFAAMWQWRRRRTRFEELPDVVRLPDGGTSFVHWFEGQRVTPGDADPTLIIIPGTTGGVTEFYTQRLVLQLSHEKMHICVLGRRGHVGAPPIASPSVAWLLGPPGDMDLLIAHVRSARPQSRLYALGFSAGANYLVQHLARAGAASPLTAGIAVQNGWDLEDGITRLCETGGVMHGMMLRSLKSAFRQHMRFLPHVNATTVLNSRTVLEFDRACTRHVIGWDGEDSMTALYAAHSSGRNIAAVTKPLLCLHAEDDPLVPPPIVPYAELGANPNIITMTTRVGSHCCWLEGPLSPLQSSWLDRVAQAFIKSVEDIHRTSDARAAGAPVVMEGARTVAVPPLPWAGHA